MTDNILLWQDKEIRFDVATSMLKQGPGEKVIRLTENIEDSKGNPGQPGTMMITNLRCIWYAQDDHKLNLSIGYKCILNVDPKLIPSKQGLSYTVNMKGKQKNSRFEFIFQTHNTDCKTLFEHLKKTVFSYEQTELYREIKARGTIAENKNLIIFQFEKVINRYINVSSVSTDSNQVQGNLYLTNVRMAWFSVTNEQFNISIPWITIKAIKRKDVKGVPSVVVETKSGHGGYIVGYRSADIDKIVLEMSKLHKFFMDSPVLGVETEFIEDGLVSQKQDFYKNFDEDIEIIDHGYNELNIANHYSMNNNQKDSQEIFFCPQLGLAVEQLPHGSKIEDLWKIIKT